MLLTSIYLSIHFIITCNYVLVLRCFIIYHLWNFSNSLTKVLAFTETQLPRSRTLWGVERLLNPNDEDKHCIMHILSRKFIWFQLTDYSLNTQFTRAGEFLRSNWWTMIEIRILGSRQNDDWSFRLFPIANCPSIRNCFQWSLLRIRQTRFGHMCCVSVMSFNFVHYAHLLSILDCWINTAHKININNFISFIGPFHRLHAIRLRFSVECILALQLRCWQTMRMLRGHCCTHSSQRCIKH